MYIIDFENNYNHLFNQIYQKYSKEMWIRSGEKGRFYSYIEAREVVIDPDTWLHTTEWQLFATLHEIGHIKTNTYDMKRYWQEYLATQWAIEESKRIGFLVSDSIIENYQNYILKWREKSVKRRAKNVKSISEVTLKM